MTTRKVGYLIGSERAGLNAGNDCPLWRLTSRSEYHSWFGLTRVALVAIDERQGHQDGFFATGS